MVVEEETIAFKKKKPLTLCEDRTALITALVIPHVCPTSELCNNQVPICFSVYKQQRKKLNASVIEQFLRCFLYRILRNRENKHHLNNTAFESHQPNSQTKEGSCRQVVGRVAAGYYTTIYITSPVQYNKKPNGRIVPRVLNSSGKVVKEVEFPSIK